MAQAPSPPPPTRFDQLKAAISAYGEAAFQNLLKSRALGDAIVMHADTRQRRLRGRVLVQQCQPPLPQSRLDMFDQEI